QLDEADTVGEFGRQLGRDLEGEPGLADAAGSRQRDEGNVVPPQQVADDLDVALAADQGGSPQVKESAADRLSPGMRPGAGHSGVHDAWFPRRDLRRRPERRESSSGVRRMLLMLLEHSTPALGDCCNSTNR